VTPRNHSRAGGEAQRRALAVARKQTLPRSLAPVADELWRAGRAGARAGRGFRFQDAVTVYLLVEEWTRGADTGFAVIPEGYEDVTVLRTSVPWHVQVKSRRESTGMYSRAELRRVLHDVVAHAIEREGTPVDGPTTLVLERGVQNLTIAPLHEIPTDTAFRLLVAEVALDAGMRPDDIADFATRFDIRLCANPLSMAVRLLADLKSVPDALAELVVAAIQDCVGQASDANFEAESSNPERISLSQLEVLFEGVVETTDVALLDASVQLGVLRSIDWAASSIADTGVFRGVPASGAITAADEFIARPKLTELAQTRLQTESILVISGPSGSGKSGLALLTATGLRHKLRWHELRTLAVSDRLGRDAVELALSRLRSLRATEFSPIGVLIDDAGQHDPVALDRLLRSLDGMKHVCIIVTVREEDRFPVAQLADNAAIRPVLDDEFAYELWRRAYDQGITDFAGWKEPAERSNGLLLEYLSILVDGDDLAATVGSQIHARERDADRRDELRILRLVACANQYGVPVLAEAAALHLGIDSLTFQIACRRLVEEHLVVDVSGALLPLHELRSAAIAHAANYMGQLEMLTELVGIVESRYLGRFLRRALDDDAAAQRLLEAGLARASLTSSIHTLIEVIAAYRSMALKDRARGWKRVLEECGVSDGLANTALSMARVELTEDFRRALQPEVSDAVLRLKSVPFSPDIEPAWAALSAIPFEPWLIADIETRGLADATAAELFLALRGAAAPSVSHELELALVEGLQSAAAADAARLLEAVRLFDENLAERLADGAVVASLLERARLETPWLLELERTAESVKGRWLFFDEQIQLDAHSAVVDACRLALALVPNADLVEISAVSMNGQPVMIGQNAALADKHIPRANLPPLSEVAENRAASRALESLLISGASLTTALESEARAVKLLQSLLPSLGQCLLSNRTLNKEELRQVEQIDTARVTLLRRPFPQESDDGLSDSDLVPTESDIASTLDTVMKVALENLVNFDLRARRPILGAAALGDAIEKVNRAIESDQFSYLADPPDLGALASDLKSLQVIAQICDNPGSPLKARMRAAANRAESSEFLRRASSVAASEAAQVLEATGSAIERAVGAVGVPCEVVVDSGRSIMSWPPGELMVILTDLDILEFFAQLPLVANVVRESRDAADRAAWITLRNRGRLLKPFTYQVTQGGLLPLAYREPPQFEVTWANAPLSSLWARAVRAARQCAALNTVVAVRRSSTVHDVEGELFQSAFDDLVEAYAAISEIAAANPNVEFIAALKHIVEQFEADARYDLQLAIQFGEGEVAGWPPAGTLGATELLDPTPEDLQNPEHPGAILVGLEFAVGLIEDDFEHADQIVAAMLTTRSEPRTR